MKKLFVFILSLLVILPAIAQENKRQTLTSKVESINEDYQDEDSMYLNGMVPVASFPSSKEEAQAADSLHLPMLDELGRVPSWRSWYHPFYGAYWDSWELHEGMNVSLGLSAFTSFGHGGTSGFAERISAMYAKPINKNLSFAIGGYLNNVSSGWGPFREGGITAMLDYRFNDRWEAYVYGQKSFVDNNSRMPMPYYDMFNVGDRIGAGVRYHFNNDSFIQVQFDYTKTPDFHQRVQDHWQQPAPPADAGQGLK